MSKKRDKIIILIERYQSRMVTCLGDYHTSTHLSLSMIKQTHNGDLRHTILNVNSYFSAQRLDDASTSRVLTGNLWALYITVKSSFFEGSCFKSNHENFFF